MNITEQLWCGMRYLALLSIMLLGAASIIASGGGGSDEEKTQAVHGGGVKGPLANANVTVYALDYTQTNFQGALVDGGTTGADAAMSGIALPLPLQSLYLVEFTSNANTKDITTCTTPGNLATCSAPIVSTLRTVMTQAMLNSGQQIYATPLTTLAVDMAILNADNSAPPYTGDGNGSVTQTEFLAALNVAAKQVVATLGFGMDLNVDIFTAVPLINSETDTDTEQAAAASYRSAVEAIGAMLYQVNNTDPQAVLTQLATDLGDGHIDGVALPATDPATWTIPNSTLTVGDVQAILVAEKTMTGGGSIDTTELEPGGSISTTVSPAQTSSNVTVPDIGGSTQSAATSAITAVGLLVGEVTNTYSATVPTGQVVSQNPIAGSVALAGSVVDFVLSLGPQPVPVPNVVGLAQSAATTAITDAGLTVGTITTEYSDTVAVGNVISQSPAAAELVNVGTSVNLVVSQGPAPVTVPNVVTPCDTEYAATITTAGLTLGAVTQQSSATVVAGCPISQSLTAGTSVAAATAMDVVVSTGPVLVTVPNVVTPCDSAYATTIVNADLVLGSVTFQSSSTVAADCPISQGLTAGSMVAAGTAMDVVVSTGVAQIAVPNVVTPCDNSFTATLVSAGLTVGAVTPQASATVPAGCPISTSPVAGTMVSNGFSIDVVVSTGPAATNVTGIWKYSNTVTTVTPLEVGGCEVMPGDHDQSYISLVQTGSSLIGVTHGVTISGTVIGGTMSGSGSWGWSDPISGVPTEEEIEVSWLYNSDGTITGTTTNTVTVDGVDQCYSEWSYTSSFVYRLRGSENYSGIYGLHIREDNGEQNTEMAELEISGSTVTVYSADSTPWRGVFDADTGAFSFGNDSYHYQDVNGDSIDDLVCVWSNLNGLVVRDPLNAGGLPVISVNDAGSEYAYYAETDPNVCDTVPRAPDQYMGSWEDDGYGKLLTSSVFTQVVRTPLEGGGSDIEHRMGIYNPALRKASDTSALSVKVLTAGETELCSAKLLDRGRLIETMPKPNMDVEAFQAEPYGLVDCKTYSESTGTMLVNGASYIVRIVDDNGTPSNDGDDIVVQQFDGADAVAEVASPAPTGLISRRDVVVNGVSSSTTETGKNIGLYGFFNPYKTLPIQIPALAGATGYRVNSRLQGEARQIWSTSGGRDRTLPVGVLDPDVPVNMSVDARYDTATGTAYAISRHLQIFPGVNGIFNVETDQTDNPFAGTFQLQMLSDGADVTCIIPNSPSVSCNASAIGIGGTFHNAIDWASDTITLNLLNIGSVQLHFLNSGYASVTMEGGYTGVARMVNPELMIRSQIRSDGQLRTVIPFINPSLMYEKAVLTYPDGITTKTFWNDIDSNPDNNFAQVVDSYRELPLDGNEAQERGGLFRTFNATVGTLEPTGTYTLNMTKAVFDVSNKSFKFDYAAPDPTGLAAPAFENITVNGITAGTGKGDTYATPITIGDASIVVSWVSNLPTDTRWTVRWSYDDGAGNRIQHLQIRTARMQLGVDPELTYNDVTNTWTWTPTMLYPLDPGSPGNLIQLRLRSTDADLTMQGDTAVVWVGY